ncbi:MAG: hypothetical protein C4297_10210 [Gemmataceae bacterium]
MSGMALTVAFEARLTMKTPQQLHVSYRLQNKTNGDLCVFDRLYRTQPSGERIMDENMAYILFEKQVTLHITRSVIRIPDGLKVEYPEVPYARLLAAGATLEASFLLAVPVVEVHPYLEPLMSDRAKERSCKSVYFSLGIAPKKPDLNLRELTAVGKGIYAADYGPALMLQQVLKSSPVAMPLTALIHDPRPKWLPD